MSKVKLTIIKDNPAATLNPNTEIIQDLDNTAEDFADMLCDYREADLFKFGSVVVYTHGVQAFIFEDIE